MSFGVVSETESRPSPDKRWSKVVKIQRIPLVASIVGRSPRRAQDSQLAHLGLTCKHTHSDVGTSFGSILGSEG